MKNSLQNYMFILLLLDFLSFFCVFLTIYKKGVKICMINELKLTTMIVESVSLWDSYKTNDKN